MPTSTAEDYLKAIYALGRDVDSSLEVPLGAISEHLGITAGTVTTMMKSLHNNGFVSYRPRRGVKLTTSGKKAALQVLRRHRLIEAFLVDIMKLDWSEVHAEAEILEHAFSDKLIDRIDEMLGFPSHDPHGDPIPSASGAVVRENLVPLSEASPGSYQLGRITRDDSAFLTWLAEHSLHPGESFKLLESDQTAGVLTLKRRRQQPFQIGLSSATALLVSNQS